MTANLSFVRQTEGIFENFFSEGQEAIKAIAANLMYFSNVKKKTTLWSGLILT